MFALIEKIKPILSIADKESDTDEMKRMHIFLISMGLLMSGSGIIWGTLCIVSNLYIVAALPYSYILLTFLNFFYLYKTKNFVVSQNIQIFMSLIFPFFFQFLIGGFVASGGTILWSVIAVFGSFTLRDKNMSIAWLILFILLMILSGIIDPVSQQFDIGLPEVYIIFFFVLNFVFVVSIIFSLYYYFVSSEEHARMELEDSLETLHQAQAQLITAEKMASLGSLVSGIAHEINTPLGVGLTGISQISNEVKKIKSNYDTESLTEEVLLTSLDVMQKLSHTIQDRLNNAATLVKSFKSISVDQHFEDQREFILKKYLDDLITSLQNPLKSKNVTIHNTIGENILMDSYPGIFSQIMTNFILNSIAHAFKEDTENVIELSAKIDDKLRISYQDNGIGLTDEVEKKIFDPFFTTKRGRGGSGLGMNIVYNLVTEKLGGSIKIFKVSPHGTGFHIILDTSLLKEQHGKH